MAKHLLRNEVYGTKLPGYRARGVRRRRSTKGMWYTYPGLLMQQDQVQEESRRNDGAMEEFE